MKTTTFLSQSLRHWFSRSLRRQRRPSPLEWRVGSHIDDFEACSVFTRVAARTVR